MTRALVTGGAGFIGLHLARRLAAEGYEVDVLDNFARGRKDEDLAEVAARPRVRLVEADVLGGGLAALGEDYGLVFHLAAIIGVGNVEQRPFAVLRDNTEMLVAALALAARQRRLERFFFASTSEVYAGTLEHHGLPIPTPEDTPLTVTDLGRPRTSYMLSKIYGEALCRQSGVPFTIVRPHNVYGPRMGMAHVVPELLGRSLAAPPNGSLDVYSVEQTRTFCYVDDATEILLRAARAQACENVTINLGAQSPEVSIGSLAERVLAATGRTDLTIVPRPAPPGSPARRCPDMTRCATLTGYRAEVGLDDGIARTLRWYQARGFLPEPATIAAR